MGLLLIRARRFGRGFTPPPNTVIIYSSDVTGSYPVARLWNTRYINLTGTTTGGIYESLQALNTYSPNGGKILLSNGKHYITSTLVIERDNITIEGDSSSKTIICANSSIDTSDSNRFSNKGMIHIKDSNNFELKNLTILYPNKDRRGDDITIPSAQYDSYLVSIDNTLETSTLKDIWIKSVHIVDQVGGVGGIQFTSLTSTSLFSNINIFDSEITSEVSTGTNTVDYDDIGARGILFNGKNGTNEKVLISRCKVDGCWRGSLAVYIDTDGYSGMWGPLSIDNSSFTNSDKYGLYLYRLYHGSLQNSEVTGHLSDGIFSFDTHDLFKITNNLIVDNIGKDFNYNRSWAPEGGTARTSHLMLSGNTFGTLSDVPYYSGSSYSETGIDISGDLKTGTIRDNTFLNCIVPFSISSAPAQSGTAGIRFFSGNNFYNCGTPHHSSSEVAYQDVIWGDNSVTSDDNFVSDDWDNATDMKGSSFDKYKLIDSGSSSEEKSNIGIYENIVGVDTTGGDITLILSEYAKAGTSVTIKNLSVDSDKVIVETTGDQKIGDPDNDRTSVDLPDGPSGFPGVAALFFFDGSHWYPAFEKTLSS